MADIQFKEEQFTQQKYASAPQARASFFVRIAMATGLAKDEKAAGPVLLGVAVLIAVIAFGLYFLTRPPSGALTPAQKAQIQEIEAATSR